MLTVIHDASILTLDQERRVLETGAVAFKDDRIVAVGSSQDVIETYPGAERRIDGKGMVAIPGIVNAHTHMAQALQRGLSDDLELLDFLRQLAYPVSQAITPQHIGVSAQLSCCEALRSGTTCIVDNITGDVDEEGVKLTAEAMANSGIRGTIAVSLAERTPRCDKWHVPDFAYTRPMEEQIARLERWMTAWDRSADGRVRLCPAPVVTWANSPQSFLDAYRLAEKHDSLLHTHVAESESEVEASLEDHGMREVDFLHELSILGPHFMVVHGVWLSDGEIELLAASGASVVHCPTSNMYLASGTARVPSLLEAGVTVALGSDGIGNHNHDMFPVLKVASLLHKGALCDPTATSAEEVLEMATLGGARALRMEEEIGSLEVGKKADIVLVRLDKPHLTPVHRLPSALVYGASGADVDTVIVDGRIVVEEGKLQTLDAARLVDDARAAAEDLVNRAGLQQLAERPWKRV
jgi:5-methylthioadenosine/S-adenosylhomocysteine deaminase